MVGSLIDDIAIGGGGSGFNFRAYQIEHIMLRYSHVQFKWFQMPTGFVHHNQLFFDS